MSYRPTAPHHQWGREAEDLAASYLQQKGFNILVRNYRYQKAEIDIIAQRGHCLAFVEVKARKSTSHGYPETFVSPAKQALIREAAENYIIEQDWTQAMQFDIIAVLQHNGNIQITHFEDAFY